MQTEVDLPMTRRIAILNTCVDDSAFAKAFPDDGEKFRQLLQPLRPDWHFETVNVKDGIFPAAAADFDGYVITGSPKSVNGPELWIARLLDLIRELDEQKIPTFGACFGHQAIAKALGGTVERSPKGWGLGTADTHFATAAPWMTPAQDDMVLFAAHEEQVTRLPPGADLLGGDDFCPIGAYRLGNHVFASEFHPEMTPDFVEALITEMSRKLDATTITRARASLQRPAEGRAMAVWIVNFLENSGA